MSEVHWENSGKTTHIFEAAVQLLGELPEHYCVYVTGAHSKWLLELEREFKRAGLKDCKILTLGDIKAGRSRACRGLLLIDDTSDLSLNDLDMVLHEKEYLEARLLPQQVDMDKIAQIKKEHGITHG